MIQENPALTQEQCKAGGIVEPGVVNYGKKDKKVKFRRSTLELEKLSLEDLKKEGFEGSRFGSVKDPTYAEGRKRVPTKKWKTFLAKEKKKPKSTTFDIRESGLQSKRAKPALDRLADQFLNAYAKDDIRYVITKSPSNPIGVFTDRDTQHLSNSLGRENDMQYIAKKSGLDVEEILDLVDDRKAYTELELHELSGEVAASTKHAEKQKFYKKAESWLNRNASRYADPDKFKKAFTRTFGKNNHFTASINKNIDQINVNFSDEFKKEIFGTGEARTLGGKTSTLRPGQKILSAISDISYSPTQLDDVFKVMIYTKNSTVRNKITNEFKKIIPTGKPTAKIEYETMKKMRDNPLFKKFGIDRKIKGPISRLIYNEIGKKLFENISDYRKPFLGTSSLLRVLRDKVDPKYKSMYQEALSAVEHAQKNLWPEAKKSLGIAEDIMFEHKIPQVLIEGGYADEINYLKMSPTTKSFNVNAKLYEYDNKIGKLARKYELALPKDKAGILDDIKDLHKTFNKKYNNYLKNVTFKDVGGKLKFESTEKPLTRKTDLVKELQKNLSSQIKNMDGKTITQYKKFYPKCFEQDVGGNALRCLTKQAEKNSEKFVKNSVSIAKATEGTKTSAQMINFLRKAKTLARGTGWLLAGEAVFAPLIALPMWAKGTPKDEIIDMLTYGAFGQGREEKIQEKLSPLGRAYAESQTISEKGQALADQINSGTIQGYDLMGAKHKLKKLEEEYNQVASIFTPDPITGDYNQELINKGAQDVEDVTKYFEDIASGSQKERAAWLAPKTSEVMETIIDKPGKAFIDFTLGPNWKENLPQYPSSTKYPHSPTTLGQHLSYDPDIPMFAEGGIAGLLKK